METKLKMLKEIYVKNGSYARELCRNLNLGMPSVKNSLNQLKEMLTARRGGRNINYTVNYSNKGVIPYLYLVEYSRIEELPKKAQYALFDYMKSLKNKPILTIIFGSYARNEYSRNSDLDLLLVFNKVTKEAEEKARVVSSKYGLTLAPVYLQYGAFSKEFFNQKKKFFQDLKKEKIILNGIEWWVELKNEEA